MMSDQNQEEAGGFSWAKKLLTVGVGTFFLTEEALKTLVQDFKFPKEVVQSLLEGAKGVRAEFMQSVVNEMMKKFSDKVNPAELLADFLRKNDVTFEVKIKVKEKSEVQAAAASDSHNA